MNYTKCLKAILSDRQCSQVDLSRILNISKQSVSRKINGHSEWRGSEIEKICEYLSLTNSEKKIFFTEYSNVNNQVKFDNEALKRCNYITDVLKNDI